MNLITLLLFLSCLGGLFISVTSSSTFFGVDDWTNKEVGEFLSSSNVIFSSAALIDLNLHGNGLLLLTSEQMSTLKISPQDYSRVLALIEKKRLSIDKNPLDFWEWRTANLRLCDMWLAPLSSSPRALLIWARFFDNNHQIELHNDEIDEISLTSFWATWLIAPSYPLYKISKK